MERKIILVCGFGRCGSSLIMQMLKAGGIDVDGVPPYYELDGTKSPEWILEQKGRALKILEPHRHGWKFLPGNYAPIWLDRDLKEQAKSHFKFQSDKRGIPLTDSRGKRRNLIKWFKQNRPLATAVCESLGKTLYLEFEDLLKYPNTCAIKLAHHCGLDSDDIKPMAAAIFDRTPGARATMDLELKLSGRSTL